MISEFIIKHAKKLIKNQSKATPLVLTGIKKGVFFIMLVQIKSDIDYRLQNWSSVTKKQPEDFINNTLDEALDDWEDYEDALRICAEIDSGRMKTYTLAEVEQHLNALDS